MEVGIGVIMEEILLSRAGFHQMQKQEWNLRGTNRSYVEQDGNLQYTDKVCQKILVGSPRARAEHLNKRWPGVIRSIIRSSPLKEVCGKCPVLDCIS